MSGVDPLSPAARKLADAMSAGFPLPAPAPVDVEALRLAASAGAGVGAGARAVVGTDADDRVADGVPVRVYRPEASSPARPLPVVVFFHGGGWVLGGLDSHDALCRELACQASMVVVSIDYRRAPEHRFPAAVDDAYAATAWVARHAAELGVDPARLAVAGDSSGGNLAAAVALQARDGGGPAIAAQLLMYPVLDHRMGTPSYTAYADGYFHTAAHMRWYWEQYLGEEGARDDPRASPGLAPDLRGLPPTVLALAECDVLRDEGLAYAERLREAGHDPYVRVWPGVFHGFVGLGRWLPEADQALTDAAERLRTLLG